MSIASVGIGTYVGNEITDQKNKIIAYKVLSNIDNYKIHSKGFTKLIAILLILYMFLPIVALYFISKTDIDVTDLSDFAKGAIFAFIPIHINIATTIGRILTEKISAPYYLLNKPEYRWGLKIAYKDELDEYKTWTQKKAINKDTSTYICLSRKTNRIINEDPVQVPYPKKSSRILWIIISFLITLFFVYGIVTTDNGSVEAMIDYAGFLTSLSCFLLAILRTIKPEW